jgi:dienelactone hydrolase
MSLLLEKYDPPWTFSARGISHPIYSAGKGTPVVVLHELPGMVEECLDLGLILAERFRVHLPLLFGRPRQFSTVAMFGYLAQLCISREIHLFAANKTSPLVDWSKDLCRKLKADSGAPGVGVIGMCLTGGFALALVADESVLAPVVAQPSLPVFVHKEALGMSPEDAAAVKARTARLGASCVLALRYAGDRMAPAERIESIRTLIGPALDYEELEGSGHATLTVQRHPRALERTLTFLTERLGAAAPPA